jgi:zinc protease
MLHSSNLIHSKRLSSVLAGLALALATALPAQAQDRVVPNIPAKPRVPIYDPGQPVERKVLKNGVRILVQEQRTSERVGGVVALKMGTLYETEDESGLGQVLMKSMLAGTESRSPVQLQLELTGADNAKIASGAGSDIGQISITTSRERAAKAVELLSDIVLHPAFPDTAFESAKALYLGKATDELESPLAASYALFLHTMYRGSAFERPAYGMVHSIAAARRSDIVSLYRKLFVGGNVTVAFVGNFDGKKVMAQLEKTFEALPAGNAPARMGGDPAAASADTLVQEERAILANAVTYGFPAPGYDDPDFPAFMVVDSYLRSGDRSPITYWLPERQIASSVGVLYPPYPKHSSVAVYYGATAANIQAARDTVSSVMRGLRTHPLDEGEWGVQIRRVQNSFFEDQSNPLVRARNLSRYETLGVGLDYPQRFETRLLQLKPEDVRAAAERWFTHSVEAMLVPTQSGSRP